MNIIKPSFQIEEQTDWSLKGIYKSIEKAGRTAYKSEHLITEDSAEKFVNMIKENRHNAVLEFGTVYLKVPHREFRTVYAGNNNNWGDLSVNPYSVYNIAHDYVHITTNYRVIIENNFNTMLEYLCKPTEFHEKRITVRFILSRAIAQEFTRHRVFSFCMESQRYCNYNKDKFNNEVTFIQPLWLEDTSKEVKMMFVDSLKTAEDIYLNLTKGKCLAEIHNVEKGLRFENREFEPIAAQFARDVLPNACKTELVMTGFISDWEHFFKLRCAKTTHPEAQRLAIPLRDEFVKRGYKTVFQKILKKEKYIL